MIDIDDTGLSLRDFIKQNGHLLSAMAVLVAIASYVSGLSVHWLASTLSFLAIAGVITLWFELNVQFPKKGPVRLFLFREILFVGLVGLIFYWFLAYPSFWNIFIFVPLFVLLFFMFITALKQLTVIPFVKRLVGISGARNNWQKVLVVVYGFVVFLILSWMFTIAVGASPVFNYILEVVRLDFR